MSRKFIQITTGWIPVFVLMLLAAALLTGSPLTAPGVAPAAEGGPIAGLHAEIRATLKDSESVRQLVDTLAHVPTRIELAIDASMPSGNKAPGRPKLVKGYGHE